MNIAYWLSAAKGGAPELPSVANAFCRLFKRVLRFWESRRRRVISSLVALIVMSGDTSFSVNEVPSGSYSR